MKIKGLFIYISAFILLLIGGGYINVSANSKQDNFNNDSQETIIFNNSYDTINFPDAFKNTEQVGSYVKSLSNKLNYTRLELKDATKQLYDSKDKKAKNIAIKCIDKVNNKLAKLNNNKEIILNDARQSIKSAENKKKNVKTDEEYINTNVSLNRSKISYSELNKVLK